MEFKMKSKHLFSACSLLLLTASCQPNQSCDVVDETYVHRYGVPLTPSDWAERGQHGQVVSTLKNGVVVCRNYESGVTHGETTYTFPHRETIHKKEVYDQGSLIEETWHYSNGMPERQVSHQSPHAHTVLKWYDGGVPQCKEEYENGSLRRGEYWTTNNLTESVIHEGEGTRLCRDPYGQLQSRDEIREGQMVNRTTFHRNGSPESINPYVNGVIEGQRRTFHPAGEPNTCEEWVNNCQHGWTQVYENGEKYADVSYVNGQKHGLEKRYRNEDTLVEEISWVQDKKHGPCHSYVGNTKRTDWYFQNQKVNKPTYDALRNQ